MQSRIWILLFLTSSLGAQLTANREAALGARMAEEIRKQTTPLGSQIVSDYITRLGESVARQSPKGEHAFTFEVVSSDRSQPLALPGGYIFVPAGRILAAGSEAELAGMLARSMARTWETVPGSSIPTIRVEGWDEAVAPRGSGRVAAADGYASGQMPIELKAVQEEIRRLKPPPSLNSSPAKR